MQQLANINQTNPWESVSLLTEINGQAFFTAREQAPHHLVDLWVTDGTQGGTTKLAGPIDLVLNGEFANVGGTFYFQGDDAAHGRELWKSDGTPAGTVLVRDFTPGAADSYLNDLVNLNGQLLFSNSGELARSNGMAAGTFRVKDLWVGQSDQVDDITLVGSSTAYFTARDAATGEALYKTDGTMAGTVLVEDALSLKDLENVSGTLFFVKDGDVWKYSGTGATELVKSGGEPRELTNVDGTLFFAAGSGAIFKSDGSAAGTVALASAGNAFNLVNMNGRLYFTGGEEFMGDGYELWTSDGTAGGTVMVKDIAPGFGYRPGYGYEGPEYIGPYGDSSRPRNFTNLSGTVYFLADSNGTQLWTTDGTTAGTVPVQEGNFTSLLNRNGTLLLAGAVPLSQGINLYNSDGTVGDATVIPRSGPGTGSSNPSAVVEVNGTLYLTADDGIHGRELWKVENGIASLVKDIVPGLPSSHIADLTNFQGKLYFTSFEETFPRRLWSSDGTSAGTAPVNDDVVVSHRGLTVVGDDLFFGASVLADGAGQELWKTDGTAAGTTRVKDINPGEDDSIPTYLVNVDGTLFFMASTVAGDELWKSDGTEAGTTMVADLNPGQRPESPSVPNSSFPSNLTSFNGTLYFIATEPETDGLGRGLWKTDGTAEGTELVKGLAQGLTVSSIAPFAVVGSMLYFVGTADDNSQGLWKTDGTTLGTVQVKEISTVRELTNVDGKLYFSAFSGSTPVLWRSNGSEAGTQPVAGAGSGPTGLVNLDGTLFFSAVFRDAANNDFGRELLNVTNGGIVEVYDLVPGSEGSDPGSLAVAGGKLYFAATGPQGRELWRALSPAAPPNNAPVLDPSGNPTLIPTAEDTLHPAGTPVASLLAGVTDQDANALRGLAVTGVGGAANGTWQYTLDNGANWLPIGIPSEQAALLLPANPQTKVRFIPNANFNGQVKLFFRAWDQTEGIAGQTFNLVGHYGGRHAFSKAYESATLTVSPVNDAPVLNATPDATLGVIQEDAQSPVGTLIKHFASSAITDIDAEALKGIAITGASAGHGTWQFTLDGSTWQSLGTPSSEASRLLPANDVARIRFIPAADYNGQVKLFYRAWDQTQGTPGGTLTTVGNTGGKRSMSTAYENATLVVKPVNDAPVLSLNVSTAGYERGSPAITLAPDATVSDIDSQNFVEGRLLVTTDTARTTGANVISIGGPFTVVDGDVRLGSTTIGRGGGPSGTGIDMVVVFNENATAAIVQQLVRALKFRSTAPAGPHSVAISVSDGDGGKSEEVMTVDVT